MATDARTATKPRRTAPVATPWGRATVIDRLTLPQRAGEKRFASVLELLETDRGEQLVRFAYTTGGVVRRGPVTLRERDLDRLRAELRARPSLRRLLWADPDGDA